MPGDLPPAPDDQEPFTVSRRDWLHRVVGVSAGAGLAVAARHPKLVPFLSPPDDLVPGVSTWYATSCRECPAGCGMIVRNREGRAVKCEGNPDHPINQGRLCARGQAALQGLYDPDRIRGPLSQGKPTTWDAALQSLGGMLRPLRGTGRVAIISDLQTGSLAALIRRWLELFGSDRYLVYEPLNYQSVRWANHTLFGQPVVPVPALDQTDFVLSFGADFLETWLSPVQFTRQFAGNRSARFVYVGPRVSMTAANADERILVRPGDERFVALAMLNAIAQERLSGKVTALPQVPLDGYAPEAVGPSIGVSGETIRRLARTFAHARAPLAIAGDPLGFRQEAAESVLAANLLNLAVGSSAFDLSTVHALTSQTDAHARSQFISDTIGGEFAAVVAIGANPEFSLRGVLDSHLSWPNAHLVALTPFADETSQLSPWVLPTHTPLESWGDYEPQTGVFNTMQPAMGPLYGTRSAGDALIALAQAAGFDPQREFGAATFRDYVFARWADRGPLDELLQRGGEWEKAATQPVRPAVHEPLPFSQPQAGGPIRLHVYPSPYLLDGRGANKRWLQELPDPITKVGWSSWIEVSPEDAQSLGLQQGDLAELSAGGAPLSVQVVVSPGIAPGTVAMPLGQGHKAYGRYAEGVGGSAFALRVTPEGPPQALGLTRLGEAALLRCADGSPYQHGRDIVRVVRASEVESLPKPELRLPLPEAYTREGDVYPPHPHRDHRWAMAVDLNRCTGCGACVTACYAENNLGVVGGEQFAKHRMMAWIRIERYYDWSDPAAPVLFLPMLCQHCDAAPCESVCPVFAAAHSEEGVNMQVYNRCIGTRYCSNNCPYKVRRFNWFDWEWPEPLNWQANPDVTVRSRGVMEKCTFCIQRIREAEVRAKREDRKLRDGDVTPACAQTCPAEALVFGDLMDPASRVARIVAEDRRAYQVLGHLNTKPAVFYLKRIVSDVL